jgi:hypothetical protein
VRWNENKDKEIPAHIMPASAVYLLTFIYFVQCCKCAVGTQCAFCYIKRSNSINNSTLVLCAVQCPHPHNRGGNSYHAGAAQHSNSRVLPCGCCINRAKLQTVAQCSARHDNGALA